VRSIAILDGVNGDAERQSRALGAFLADGLTGDLATETLIFYHDERERLVSLAPTREVRLVRIEPRSPDQTTVILAGMAAEEEIALFLFAGGDRATDQAARLAGRTAGAVLTGALSAEVATGRLRVRKNVYSSHMTGRFALTAQPWCVSVDQTWEDARADSPLEHRILSESDTTGSAQVTPFEDTEFIARPSAGGLAESRFLVVAGQGVAGREGVERVAEAARRMGATFGVSRPVAMNAWAPMDRLVGVSGARTAPLACIVVGASGAPALFWGVEAAKLIAAVNPDEKAAIVGNADVAILDDGVTVIEELADIIADERRSD